MANLPTVLVREERASDRAQIYDTTQQAFADRSYAAGDEQDLVDALRAAGALLLSLVAEHNGEVVGQITFSPVSSDAADQTWVALGPVSVRPDLQLRRIGSQLIEAGLERVRSDGASGCILTGNPRYYERFGFALAPQHCPDSEPPEHFMIKTFGEAPIGKLHFHPLFYS